MLMTDHVTQDQLNNHLVLIHQTIRDSNDRTDKHLSEFSKNLETIARESQETRLEILDIVKDISHKTNDHGTRLAKSEAQITVLNEHRIKTGAYWAIAGLVLTPILGAVVKLLFFP